MTYDTATVRDWALKEAGSLALKALAEDMPGVRDAPKPEVVDWLVANDLDRLVESYRLSQRKIIHMTETRYSVIDNQYIAGCRCGWKGRYLDSRAAARAEGDEHLDKENAPAQ